jgi:Uma2 family endonuclease
MSLVDPDYITSPNWPRPKAGEPAWQVAFLFPAEGEWSEADYLSLDRGGGRRMIELVDGRLEVLPMPTIFHQRIVEFLFYQLRSFVKEKSLGSLFFAPLPVYFDKKNYREPDIVFVRPERIVDRDYPAGADLVIEVVSSDPEGRQRDLQAKRRDYALARIPEYWIVDPQEQTVTVLTLNENQYQVHGEFKPGTKATSVLLPEFSIDVAELFAAAKA